MSAPCLSTAAAAAAIVGGEAPARVRSRLADGALPAAAWPALPAGVWARCQRCDDYPARLAQAAAPPPVLFGRGDPAALAAAGVAVVGAREVTGYGRVVARIAAGAAATVGAPVVSGLARGVDGVAHDAALDAGATTVAVIASSPHAPTPTRHAALADRIVAGGGAVVSEQPPAVTAARPAALHARNRLVAALAAVVVVAEATVASGTRTCVLAALDQGRQLVVAPPHWPVPGGAMPQLLADPEGADLRQIGASAAQARRHAHRRPVADGVAGDRAGLDAAVRLAWGLSPLH